MAPGNAKPQLDAVAGMASPLGAAISVGDQETISMVADAVRTKRLRLAYQPVVLSRDPGRVAFHEGLIRVEEPNGRIIPAKDFIEVVEGQELGRELDSAALEFGLATLARHKDQRVSINMSARSIGYPRWKWVLKKGLERDPTVAERLILEISEASAMLLPELVLAFMNEMSRKGVAFALDDFGAGFTAIRHFREFMFDILKIHNQFIRGIARNPDNHAVTGALLAIGKRFEMFTVAMGVETPEEAECLRLMGIHCQQGFLHGAPTVKPAWAEAERKRA